MSVPPLTTVAMFFWGRVGSYMPSNRIRAIAMVHEQLDNSERFDAIRLRDYLEHLLSYLQISHREYSVGMQTDIDAEVAIKLESATHIGLLVHELVLCSYRHSFEPGVSGTISVSVGTENGFLRISIIDTGTGLYCGSLFKWIWFVSVCIHSY